MLQTALNETWGLFTAVGTHRRLQVELLVPQTKLLVAPCARGRRVVSEDAIVYAHLNPPPNRRVGC